MMLSAPPRRCEVLYEMTMQVAELPIRRIFRKKENSLFLNKLWCPKFDSHFNS